MYIKVMGVRRGDAKVETKKLVTRMQQQKNDSRLDNKERWIAAP